MPKCEKKDAVAGFFLEDSRKFAPRFSLADVAQLVEHVHGKDGVSGSNPDIGSLNRQKGFEEARMWDARSASHALDASVSFSTKLECLYDFARTHFIKNS